MIERNIVQIRVSKKDVPMPRMCIPRVLYHIPTSGFCFFLLFVFFKKFEQITNVQTLPIISAHGVLPCILITIF